MLVAAPTVRSTVLPRRDGVQPGSEIPAQPRFQHIRQLGQGGIGEVALAQDQDISRRVAMKRLLVDRRDEQSLIRFAEEARIVGQLEHPGIVPVHDVGIDEDGHYLVMKYVEGDTLEQVIEKLRAGDPTFVERFTYSYRSQVLASILEAISYAHDKGIIHRDLKPANIMIGPYGEITIMDWGIAKHIGTLEAESTESKPFASTMQDRLIHTQDGALIGTPLYMSPEQAAGRNQELDAHSDIYSLGLLFCEFLLLKHPLAHLRGIELVAELIAKGVDLAALERDARNAGVPVELAAVLEEALQFEPTKRYSSVKAMLAHLRRIQSGEVRVQCHVTLFKRIAYGAIHWVDRHVQLFTLLLLGFGITVLAGIGFGILSLLR